MTLASSFLVALVAISGVLVLLTIATTAHKALRAARARRQARVEARTGACSSEFSFHRYRRWRDLASAFLAAIVENVGYRQLHAWWRLQGLWRFIRRQDNGWGVMTRVGFTTPSPADEPA
ncbi:MAG TPA: hypothetical protein VF032_20705 [Thermoleophilaceae bacterium]